MARLTADSAGQLALPICLALTILMGGAIGVLTLRLNWRSQVQTQRRIDQCVQSRAMELVHLQNELEVANNALIAARAVKHTAPAPPVVAAAAATIAAAVLLQELLRGSWRFKQALWLTRRGCDATADRPLPLPNLLWTRDPPDGDGPKPLHWDGDKSDGLSITLNHGLRFSAAKIKPDGLLWRADWSAALGLF